MSYCSVVAVLALVVLTKKRSVHYAILIILSLRSPRGCSVFIGLQFLQRVP